MNIIGFTIETENKTPCDKCLEHIGDFYENANDLPKIPFHYGYKCFYKAQYDNVNLRELKDIVNSIINSGTIKERKEQINIVKKDIESLKSDMDRDIKIS